MKGKMTVYSWSILWAGMVLHAPLTKAAVTTGADFLQLQYAKEFSS